MNQRTIAFVGISGVGKSTFLRSAAKKIAFQHLTAGSLICRARESVSVRDLLRLQNLDENQRVLVAGFQMARASTSQLVVMDGHVIVDGADGLEAISSNVFAALGADAIVHLKAEPVQILTNREGEKSRDRPRLTLSQLADHQSRSLDAASTIALSLSIPFKLLTYEQINEFCSFATSL